MKVFRRDYHPFRQRWTREDDFAFAHMRNRCRGFMAEIYRHSSTIKHAGPGKLHH